MAQSSLILPVIIRHIMVTDRGWYGHAQGSGGSGLEIGSEGLMGGYVMTCVLSMSFPGGGEFSYWGRSNPYASDTRPISPIQGFGGDVQEGED